MQEITQKTAITGRNDCYRETEICCQQKLATIKGKKKEILERLAQILFDQRCQQFATTPSAPLAPVWVNVNVPHASPVIAPVGTAPRV